ncbi:MAG TPA: hypothetical protein VMH00_16000 [Candidatus Limnocylindrales bacterium]|nr:hypothetical protein [Candidatus Limnocylindrales bacterium]
MPVCDGCGARVDDAHIRQRIERLELATRFRPIHIHLLLMDAAPPSRPEDFFYRVSRPSARSVASRMYFTELAKLVGVKPGREGPEETTLGEFQKRGMFLTYAVECPVEDYNELSAAVRRLAPTVVKRVQTSYQPKYIAPISQPTQELVKLFQMTGLGDRLVLNEGAPFVDPFIGDPQNQAEFGTSLGDRLLSAVAQLP